MNTYPFTFESPNPWFSIKGSFQIYFIECSDQNGIISTNTNQPWQIKCVWATEGHLSYRAAGKWSLSISAKQTSGGTFYIERCPQEVPFIKGPCAYWLDTTISANSLPLGLYNIEVVLTFIDASGIIGSIAGVALSEKICLFKKETPHTLSKRKNIIRKTIEKDKTSFGLCSQNYSNKIILR